RGLGFPVPSVPEYSIQRSINAGEQFATSIAGPADFNTVVGAFLSTAQEIEAVLRATSVAWARSATRRWHDLIISTAGAASGDRRPDKLTFGHWKAIFCGLPRALIDEESRRSRPRRWLESCLVSYAREIKSTKAVKKLDSLVAARNTAAHS